MSMRMESTDEAAEARSRCSGVVPLPARLEPWQIALCNQPALLAGWIETYGSPLNVLDPSPLARNAGELQREADRLGADLKIFFARKANKALAFVDEARGCGLGVDVAGEQELRQVLESGIRPADIVVTAAVKPRALLELCVSAGATVVLDNEDELRLLASVAAGSPHSVPVALRLAPTLARDKPISRFGLAPAKLIELVERFWPSGPARPLTITGLHFHLDGYEAGDRVSALAESLVLVDALRDRGHLPAFIDIGGGLPMSYLDDAAGWERFWCEHRAGLLGEREPLTFEAHGLGLSVHDDEITGRPNLYPYFQETTRGDWLAGVLGADLTTRTGTQTAAEALWARGLQVRCEPGRSLVDGCGLTAARVEFRKQRPDGTWLVGVAMNRTQCRSTSDDFLVDPLLLRPVADAGPEGAATGAIEGYLVGAYCIERELLTWRRLSFPHGVAVGDIVVFPNTAGYLMHIVESASHQLPLARNLVATSLERPFLDRIDARGE